MKAMSEWPNSTKCCTALRMPMRWSTRTVLKSLSSMRCCRVTVGIFLLFQHVQSGFVHLRSHQGNAVHAALHHAVQCLLEAPEPTVVRIRENHFVRLFRRQAFKAADEVWKKWICNVGDDDAEKIAAALTEAAGAAVGDVAEFFDDFANSRRRLFPDQR